jgi:hypothetical protein
LHGREDITDASVFPGLAPSRRDTWAKSREGWHNGAPVSSPPAVIARSSASRPLILAASFAALLGGCVIPIGPQFDDAEPNYPPYVVSSNPTVGEIFTPGMTVEDREITATLSDQNLKDHLFIRWLVDYPSNDMNPTAHQLLQVEFPESTTALRPTVRIRPRCDFIGLGPGPHRLVMSVSDRPYLDALSGLDVDPEAPLDSVPEGANRLRTLWILNCP